MADDLVRRCPERLPVTKSTFSYWLTVTCGSSDSTCALAIVERIQVERYRVVAADVLPPGDVGADRGRIVLADEHDIQVAVIVREERSGRLADGRSVTRLALAEVDNWRAATVGGPIRSVDEPFKSRRLVHAGDLEGGRARGILGLNRRCQREECREQRGETLESDRRYESVRNVHSLRGDSEPARTLLSKSRLLA